MRRIAAACAALAILSLTGCFTSFERLEQPGPSAIREMEKDSPERFAKFACISLINAVDKKDLDNFLRFSDMEYLAEAAGNDPEQTKAEMEKTDWSVLFSTDLVESVGNGVYVNDIQDRLSYLKGSEEYPAIDLDRITGAYRYELPGSGQVYVLCIDGEWKVDLALVNVAERIQNEQEKDS